MTSQGISRKKSTQHNVFPHSDYLSTELFWPQNHHLHKIFSLTFSFFQKILSIFAFRKLKQLFWVQFFTGTALVKNFQNNLK